VSSLGLLALAAVLRDGSYERLVDMGFEEEDLATKEEKALYEFLRSYHEDPLTRGGTPSLSYVQAQYPELVLPDVANMQLQELVGSLRQSRVAREARTILTRAHKLVSVPHNPSIITDLMNLQEEIGHLIGKGSSANTDSNEMVGLQEAVDRIELQRAGKIYFHPWPWPELHAWSPGMEDTDFTVIYGRPKNKKSFLILFFVIQAFLSGGNVLLYSKEMPKEQIWRRVLAFLANLPYDVVTLAKFTEDEYLAMYNALAMVEQHVRAGKGRITCVSGMDAPQGSDTVGWLGSKIKQYKPTLVVIDGLYLMAGPKVKDDHERVRIISRDVRQMALRLRVPVVATVQANRKVGNKAALDSPDSDLDDVAMSDGLSMDATALFRIIADRTFPTATIKVSGGREFKLAGFRINALPCSDFSFIGPVNEREVLEAAAGDVGDDDEPAMTAATVRKRGKRTKKEEDPLASHIKSRLLEVD
jgi:replicative DNA helicase